MRLVVESLELLKQRSQAVALGLFTDLKLGADAAKIDNALSGAISKLLKAKAFKGKVGECQALPTLGKLAFDNVIMVGLGDRQKFSTEAMRRASASMSALAQKLNIKSIASKMHYIEDIEPQPAELARASAEGFLLAQYRYERKRESEPRTQCDLVLVSETRDESAMAAMAKEVEGIVERVFWVRDLVNLPGSEKTPERLAQMIKAKLSKRTKVKIYNAKQLKRLGFGALLAVARGSCHEPRLVHITHEPKNALGCIALVGKGITFDSGGLNLKPWEAMAHMQSDMAGAAICAGVVDAAAALNIRLRLHALLPLTENMPSADAQKPGDIIVAQNRKTIEVVHTDAEGRLILADALGYAEALKPDAIIDVATLTGAAVVALGRHFIAALGSDEALIEGLRRAGEATGERVWQLPLIDDHLELVKSEIADVRNTSPQRLHGLGEAGCIAGAAFLQNFVTRPWAHLDIASVSYLEKDERPYLKPGATGIGVRLLIEFLKRYEAKLREAR